MLIRSFQENDREQLLALWEACDLTRPWNDPDKDIDRKVAFQPELFLVLEINGSIQASAMAGYDGHRGSVYYLGVSPKHQKQGLGEALMLEVEKRLITLGCAKLNILIRITNEQALGFYKKLSYENDKVLCVGKRIIADA